MIITFKHTGGPYGDCTSNYDVEIPEGTSVWEFVKYIVGDYSISHGEWGYFSIYADKDLPRHGHTLISYNRGEMFFEPPWTPKEVCEPLIAAFSNRIIKRVKANGGWSNMCYDLYVEDAE